MARAKPEHQKVYVMLLMLPMWTNLLIRTYSIMAILDDGGFLNTILNTSMHIVGTKGAVIFGMVYDFLPYMVLPIYTCVSKIDKHMWEAASDLGCTPVQTLTKVILPLSMSGIISGVTMVLVPSISTFYISQKLGGVDTLLIGDVIEQQYAASNYNMTASLSLILMLILLVGLAIVNHYSEGDEGGGIVL
jgi:spermidine/putrescine transport system permease protein